MISRLKAVVNFFIGLDQIYYPEEYQNLNEEVIKTVSHYLMSRKCSEQYGLWTKERIKFGLKMNRQEIFRIVEMLFENEELKPSKKLFIPRFVLNTLLNQLEEEI